MPNKFPDIEKRELGIQMMHFCEKLFDEFTEHYEQTTGEEFNEELFDEMLLNLEDTNIDD